jgi:hypothetical protein
MESSFVRYKRQRSFVLGFHGCSREIGEAVLAGRAQLQRSDNDYDWLGPGIYFWEDDPERALQFAADAAERNPKITRGKILSPFVLGAIIDPGLCFNLLDSSALRELRDGYDSLARALAACGVPMPENVIGADQLKRKLDCATINAMHGIREMVGIRAYDSVRGAFWEGGELYPGAKMSSKGHVQIAVTNPDCILGYFRPLLG